MLKIAYFNGDNPFNFFEAKFHLNTLGGYGLTKPN